MKRALVLPALLGLMVGLAAAPAHAAPPENFRTHLTGAEEVPAVDTRAQGQAVLRLHAGGDALDYRLIVANIAHVTQAHIHCGAAGVNGPVVAFLFGLVEDGVTTNGVLATGTVTPADVIPRPDSAECPGGVADFDEMVARIRSGDAYVNVHTVQNPPGEIRGQIG
jgi:hypothetical protein